MQYDEAEAAVASDVITRTNPFKCCSQGATALTEFNSFRLSENDKNMRRKTPLQQRAFIWKQLLSMVQARVDWERTGIANLLNYTWNSYDVRANLESFLSCKYQLVATPSSSSFTSSWAGDVSIKFMERRTEHFNDKSLGAGKTLKCAQVSSTFVLVLQP